MSKLLEVNNLLLKTKESNSDLLEIKSLQINQGEQIIVFGDNGSGKSTFLKCFCRSIGTEYCEISSGSITLFCDDKEVDLLTFSDDKLVNENVVYVGQEEDYAFGYFDSIITALNKKSLEWAEESQKEGIKKIANELALKYFKEIYVHDRRYLSAKQGEKDKVALRILSRKLARNCSSGYKKIISILRAIIFARTFKSSLLVLDEPLNHLDYKNKKIVNDEINNLIKENKDISLLVITHCMIFDFLNNASCKQYRIERKEDKNVLEEIPNNKHKKKINCLEDC